MKTTKRTKKTKEPKIVPTIKEEQVVKPVEVKTQLDQGHLLQLETISRDIENAKLLMALEEQALKNMSLEKSILENKIEKQKMIVREKAMAYELVKKQFIGFQKEIWPLYGLKENEGMGYDPLSGEIKRN